MSKCPYCNAFHEGRCPLVKAIDYNPDGTIKRVEFYSPSDYLPVQQGPALPSPPWRVT